MICANFDGDFLEDSRKSEIIVNKTTMKRREY